MAKASRRFLRPAILLGAAVLLGLTALLVGADLVVSGAAEGRCHASVDTVPHRKVAMVLGCPKFHKNGAAATEYKHRVDAAAELFRAGKCDMVLVSSDADAPVMADDVVAAGVPAERVLVDPLGVRTRASFVHAQEAFGLNGGIVVSQRYHNERSLYIAEELGGDWIGFDAPDSTGVNRLRSMGREALARVKAVLDRYVLDPVRPEKN